MPSIKVYFTPRRRKNHGSVTMKSNSDICPMVILAAAFCTPISFRNGLVNV